MKVSAVLAGLPWLRPLTWGLTDRALGLEALARSHLESNSIHMESPLECTTSSAATWTWTRGPSSSPRTALTSEKRSRSRRT
uniref:Putative secreted protein n=1 Tax=Ixodes ricinus TaxID=34613 RepID=A0A6B0U8I7_IXORI